jgi:hypothetical protein
MRIALKLVPVLALLATGVSFGQTAKPSTQQAKPKASSSKQMVMDRRCTNR